MGMTRNTGLSSLGTMELTELLGRKEVCGGWEALKVFVREKEVEQQRRKQILHLKIIGENNMDFISVFVRPPS
ncbi:hypothetical protein SUGI_0127880 [Cryptomeria japonica]|nr:hypothetical protein SUGI_0127880 [Cryptomeria japonica]